MKDLDVLKEAYDKIGVDYVIRKGEGCDSYLFVGKPEDALCLTGLNDNFETTALDALLRRHGFFEFEDGKLAGYSIS